MKSCFANAVMRRTSHDCRKNVTVSDGSKKIDQFSESEDSGASLETPNGNEGTHLQLWKARDVDLGLRVGL